jgi:hypothetical protein
MPVGDLHQRLHLLGRGRRDGGSSPQLARLVTKRRIVIAVEFEVLGLSKHPLIAHNRCELGQRSSKSCRIAIRW